MSSSIERGDVIGAVVLAFGAAIAAFGDTLIAKTDDATLERKGVEAVIYGSLTEATGNFLQTGARLKADPTNIKIGTIGSGIQGVGNVINTIGGFFLLDDQETKGFQIDFVGDSVQALGASLETIGALQSNFYYRSILAIGEALQAYGAAVEAYGNILLLSNKREEGEVTQAFGSQILFVGTVISAEALAFELKRKEATAER